MLFEIDLLRTGKSLPITGASPSDYRILVIRAQTRPSADLYAFHLRDTIPVFALPLEIGDREPSIDLSALLEQVYEEAALNLDIYYL